MSIDPDRCVSILEAKIRIQLNHFCQQKDLKVKAIREPWITGELLDDIKEKDTYLEIAKGSVNVDD